MGQQTIYDSTVGPKLTINVGNCVAKIRKSKIIELDTLSQDIISLNSGCDE
jgi:hypothetical protein